jgi:hypothetical protein
MQQQKFQIKSGGKSKCYKEFGLCDSTSNNKKKKMSGTEARCEVAIAEEFIRDNYELILTKTRTKHSNELLIFKINKKW